MLIQFFSIGLLMLLAVILPGPDFALVTKNTLQYGRRTGIFTSLGMGSAALVHMSYCMLGLAVIIAQSLLLFNIIKYMGAAYLIFLGVNSLRAKVSSNKTIASTNAYKNKAQEKHDSLSKLTAFRQGFLCNLLNPKATLFFLSLFTVVIKPHTPSGWLVAYIVEMLAIIVVWFVCLTIFLSHPRIVKALNTVEKYLPKVLGIFLIGFGVTLIFLQK